MKPVCLLLLACFAAVTSTAQLSVKDIFGRELAGQNITLVDWEGYMANPAIQITIQAPANATFPLAVSVSVNGARLYFDLPATTGSAGPSKSITLTNTSPVSFYLSNFPDRAGDNENYTLTINSNLGLQTFPILVIDQDASVPSVDYNIITDFSKDNAHNFFANTTYRDIVVQAANDWAFFIQNMNFDNVAANNEHTFIWNDDFNGGNWTTNQTAYNGFLLYAYGIHTTPHRSGGEPSLHSFQKIAGVNTQLRRSGGYEAEIHGNYNTLGWNTSVADDTWYQATNFGNVPNDLYSVALHEIGHAICFNPGYPVFQTYKAQGFINDADVMAYQGTNVPVDAFDHLSNGASDDGLKLVDRISKKGAYGSEYAAVMPYGRWLITKLNLLTLKAIGYSIKQTSAFSSPAISTNSLPPDTIGQQYAVQITVQGGIPFYKYEVVSGTLPPGLVLNSFTGTISGIPTAGGNYSFTVRVTDYDNSFVEKLFAINIAAIYTFTGNGDWTLAANWAGNLVAPVPVPAGVEVVINHQHGGQCTFNGNLLIQPGGQLTLKAGKGLNIIPQ